MPFSIATTVVSIFAEQSAARAALDQNALQGVPSLRVTMHEKTPISRNAAALEADELFTGGFISNMSALLDGLFSHPVAEGDAATYADVVRSEGTLVSLEGQGHEEAQMYEDVLPRAGALRISILPAEDTVSCHRLHGP